MRKIFGRTVVLFFTNISGRFQNITKQKGKISFFQTEKTCLLLTLLMIVSSQSRASAELTLLSKLTAITRSFSCKFNTFFIAF